MKLSSSIERQLQRIEERAKPYALLACVCCNFPPEDRVAAAHFLVTLADCGAVIEPGPELREMAKEWWNGPDAAPDSPTVTFNGVPTGELSDQALMVLIFAETLDILRQLPDEFKLPDSESRVLEACRQWIDEPISDADLMARLESDFARFAAENPPASPY